MPASTGNTCVPLPTLTIIHCPCGILRSYAECCGRFHAGEQPDSAPKLMRARYSAYALRLPEYLLATWHPSTRPAELRLDPAEALRWLGLDIRAQQSSGDSARVEFIARFRQGDGGVQRQHEISRFVREQGRWFYLDGEFPPAPAKLGQKRQA